MTPEQQAAWARLARAASAVGELYLAGANKPKANGELFDATVAAVFARLPLSEVAGAMRAGWPELGPIEALDNVEGLLERQANLDRDHLRWTLADLARPSAS